MCLIVEQMLPVVNKTGKVPSYGWLAKKTMTTSYIINYNLGTAMKKAEEF